jgi:small-conductance mechanosensitive channel
MLRMETPVADQALRDSNASMAANWLMRGVKAEGLKSVTQNAAPVPLPDTQPRIAPEPQANPVPSRDWSSALDLIQEATEAISISEERAADLEAQLHQVTTNANEEIRQLSAKVAASERRAQKAEERARSAEARASEAETWLVRMHDAVLNGFGRKSRAATQRIEAGSRDASASESASEA